MLKKEGEEMAYELKRDEHAAHYEDDLRGMNEPLGPDAPREVLAPVVHLNGTSGEELLRQVTDAWTAVAKAIEALRAAAPHGRDYYPKGDGAHKRATDEHRDRMAHLYAVRDELRAIHRAVQVQQRRRA